MQASQDHICYIFPQKSNKYLRATCEVSDNWMNANVIPLFKKGSKDKPRGNMENIDCIV